jgi:hypothetical protein
MRCILPIEKSVRSWDCYEKAIQSTGNKQIEVKFSLFRRRGIFENKRFYFAGNCKRVNLNVNRKMLRGLYEDESN